MKFFAHFLKRIFKCKKFYQRLYFCIIGRKPVHHGKICFLSLHLHFIIFIYFFLLHNSYNNKYNFFCLLVHIWHLFSQYFFLCFFIRFFSVTFSHSLYTSLTLSFCCILELYFFVYLKHYSKKNLI